MINLFPPYRRVKKYLVAAIILAVIKLFWVPHFLLSSTELGSARGREDLLLRRRHLIERTTAVDFSPATAFRALPAQFRGEWVIGTLSMTSAALTNIAFRFPETATEAREVIRTLISKALSKEARDFDLQRWGADPLDTLESEAGHIGYLGHLNFMLGAYGMVGGTDFEDLYRSVSFALARKLEKRPGFCLETYPAEIYLPDNLVVFASLRLYDRLYNVDSSTVVDRWLAFAKDHLIDSETRLLPFWLDNSCRALGSPRGSGAGWASFYLPFIDPTFAEDQYAAFKKHFYQRRLIGGFREFPRSSWKIVGDVDSGPVLAGFSPSGTGFALAGAVLYGDEETINDILFTSELVGSTVQYGEQRWYLAAPLVGDAIMLAMKTAIRWEKPLRE